MKKIVISGLMLLTLTSCGEPMVESPIDALKKNQVSLIESYEKIFATIPESGNSKGDMIFDIAMKEGKSKINVNYNSDYQNKGLNSSNHLKVDFDATANSGSVLPVNSLNGTLDLDFIALNNKTNFKLNKLQVNGLDEIPQASMALGMVSGFTNKWFFIEDEIGAGIKKEIFQYLPQLVETGKNNNIFELVKENENKDMYDYDVKLSEKSIIAFGKSGNKLINIIKKSIPQGETSLNSTGSLTQEDITNIKTSVKEVNEKIAINIKINKKDLQLFTLTIQDKKDIKNGTLTIESSKENFNITAQLEKEGFTFKLLSKKVDGGIQGTFSVASKLSKINMEGNIFYTYKKLKTLLKLDGTIAIPTGEKVTFSVNMNDIMTAKEVKIESPAGATDFQKLVQSMMGGMMGGAQPQAIDIDSEVDTTLENIEQQADVLENNIDAQVDTLEKSLNSQADELEKNIQKQSDELEKNIDTQVDTLEKSLNSQVSEGEKNIQKQSDELEKNINTQVKNIEENINIQNAKLEKTVEGKVEAIMQ